MRYEWDENKRIKNLKEHGVDFYSVYEFDLNSAFKIPDTRFDYNEERFIAFGYRKNRLHVLVYTERQNSIRVISFRKANKREVRDYEKEKNDSR